MSIGDEVINMGQRATIIGIHPVTQDFILLGTDGFKWLASPALCEPVESTWIHSDGLVIIGG